MEKTRPTLVRAARRPELAHREPASDLNLLLVSRSLAWSKAVLGATRTLGRVDILTGGARDAVARLAGTASHYSHLLVDRNDADGLLNELADLATEIVSPDTDMLVLGAADHSKPQFRFISAATPRSVFEALMATTPRRGRLAMDVAELRTALTSTMIETRYQPIVRVSDRRPVGLEALVRLNHPKKGTIPPDSFVPQIEHAGLAAELTGVVSARAFADLAGPLLAGLKLRMSVNFPLDVLLMPSALERLEAQREIAALPADRIIVELTESRPAEDISRLRRSLEHLRQLGYGVAIDDVGPAVPHLEPLLDLPFTSLKLDKYLVQRVAKSAEARAILATTIVQAKTSGFKVTAEGVETEEIWDHMAALGVDEMQGFLAARPLSVAAVPVWWEAWVGKAAAGA
ncbi:MAG TPA: EAL domain-containing protein [Rhodopila sp.]|jgi:EAL domain-containing protein (putative c-di-GMP-specific phosphodiesterase class I)